jgi:hypothetical protein
LYNHCQGLRRTFSEICKKFDEHSLSDPSHHARHKNQNVPRVSDILYTDSQYMLVLSSTTAVQKAVPVSEILDTPLYTVSD